MAPRVIYVLRPRPTLDIDDLIGWRENDKKEILIKNFPVELECRNAKLTQWPNELDRNQRTEISFVVHVGVEVWWESSRVVFNVSQNFFVSWVLALTSHPNLIAFILWETGNVLFKVGWHVGWQGSGVVVIIGLPAEDSIEFDEDARRWVAVAVSFIRFTIAEQRALGVYFANLT